MDGDHPTSRGDDVPSSASGWMAAEPGTLSMRARNSSAAGSAAAAPTTTTSIVTPLSSSTSSTPPTPNLLLGGTTERTPHHSPTRRETQQQQHHHSNPKDSGTASMRSKKHKRINSSSVRGAVTSVRSSGGPSARQHTAQTTQKVVQLAMDPSLPDGMTKSDRPWVALGVVVAIIGLQIASAVLSAPGSGGSSDAQTSLADNSEGFTTAGWASHYAGLICLVSAVLVVLIRRRPLHTEVSVLLLSFLALVLLVAAAVLHTSRLNVSAASLLSSSEEDSNTGTPAKHVRAAQLGWLANILLYLCLSVLVYRSPRPTFLFPSSREHDKLDALATVREAETMRRKVVQAITEREDEVAQEEQAKQRELDAQLQAYEARKVAAREQHQQQQQQTPLILASDPTSPTGPAPLLFTDVVEPNTPLPRSGGGSQGAVPFTPHSAAGISSQRGRAIISRGGDDDD